MIRWVFDGHREDSSYLSVLLITLVKDLLANVVIKKRDRIGADDGDDGCEVDIFFHKIL